MYSVFFDKILLPVTPSKIKTKISNKNKKVELINDLDANIIKNPGLTEISMEIDLPNVKYPYARYLNGFKSAIYYLNIIEKYKISKKPFQLIVSRKLPKGKKLFYTNIKVTVEDYEITDEAGNGFDVKVNIKLKQYREYGTKKPIINKSKKETTIKKKDSRSKGKEPDKSKYKVVYGDCLWNIAKKYYGDGSEYMKIYNANKNAIEADAKKHGFESSRNGDRIWPGLLLVIPK